MKTKGSIRLMMLSLILPVFMGCAPAKEGDKKNPTAGDFIITTETPWENTLVALAPGESPANNGTAKLVLSGGQNTAHQIYSKDLYKPDGSVDSNTTLNAFSLPAPANSQDGTDNQVIKLSNGSLLALRNGTTWSQMTNPPTWANEPNIVGGGGFKAGSRGCINMYRSDDGGMTWNYYSSIDFGSEKFRKYGAPRPMKVDVSDPNNGSKYKPDCDPKDQSVDNAGNKYWWIGGGDRTEMYRCPFTKNIYVTTRIISGTGLDNTLLFYSQDDGKKWKLLKDDLPGWSPSVMTSTANGRLFVFLEYGSTPVLYMTHRDAISNELRMDNTSFQVYSNHLVNGTKVNVSVAFPPARAYKIDQLGVGTHSICRATGSNKNVNDAVILAYQAADPGNDSNQVYEIVMVTFKTKDQHVLDLSPSVLPLATIKAEDPVNYSVMHGTFIEPDYATVPDSVTSPLAMFYWIEAPRDAAKKSKIRGAFVKGFSSSKPFYLSLKDNLPRTVATPVHVGDYMKGAFYWYNGRYHFVAQWPEADGIHCNIVSAIPNLSMK
jgi:hypothetical protein